MGETSETEETGLRRSARKRTLADMLVNGNEDEGKEEKEEEPQGNGSSLKSGFPSSFRSSSGKLLRVVKKPVQPAPVVDKGGATAVIGAGVPLDLAAILGGFNATPPPVSKPTLGESTPTLAELLSSMNEETAMCSSATEGMKCETDECKATMDELVPLASDISRIESKIEKMISMVRGHYGLPIQRLAQRVVGPSGLPRAPVMVRSTNFPPVNAGGGAPRFTGAMRSLSDPIPHPPSFKARGVQPMGPAALRYRIKTISDTRTATHPASGQTARPFPQPLNQPIRRPPYLVNPPTPSTAKPLPKKSDPTSILNTLFSPNPQPSSMSPKVPQTDAANNRIQLARALLLFPGLEFTYGDFCEKSPGIVKDLSKSQIQAILTNLSDNELLYQEDDSQGMTKRSTVWQKETSKGRLKNLKKYGISVDEYLNTLDEE